MTEPVERISPTADDGDQREAQAADRVRLQYKGVRVTVTGIPSRRGVSETQKSRAAGLFQADSGSVSMSSLLWDAGEPAVKALRAVTGAIQRTFHDRSMTLPTAHPGLRMLKRNCLTIFNDQMQLHSSELAARAEALYHELPAIIERERERRGELFNLADYDFDPREHCKVVWAFPSVVEDQELAQIDDEIYQAELRRVRRDMVEVVRQAESQMAEHLHEMLQHISERMQNDEEGQPRKFQNNTVAKLFDELDLMSERLKQTGIGGEGLQDAARRLKNLLDGQNRETLPEALRSAAGYRQEFQQQCLQIADKLLEDSIPPRRRVILRKRAAVKQR